jgi:hypothetical protein
MSVLRQNTVVFTFPPEAERPKAVDIHKFLKSTVELVNDEVLCIQLDATVKRFFVKLSTVDRCDVIVSRHGGEYAFVYPGGGSVKLTARHSSGLGRRVVRVFDIPIESSDDCIVSALSPFGTIVSVNAEMWSFAGYFNCPSGVRQVVIDLNKPIPSFVHIGRFGKVMVSYSGQAMTCAVCDEASHTRRDCPRRHRPRG